MSDDKELIAMARLAQRDERMSTGALYGDLADRIEALIAERDDYAHKLMQANNTYTEMHLEIERLSDKLAKALEALLWCSGSNDFNEGGIARKGWLKVCAPILFAELTGGKDD